MAPKYKPLAMLDMYYLQKQKKEENMQHWHLELGFSVLQYF